jgi:hypothetical protein
VKERGADSRRKGNQGQSPQMLETVTPRRPQDRDAGKNESDVRPGIRRLPDP